MIIRRVADSEINVAIGLWPARSHIGGDDITLEDLSLGRLVGDLTHEVTHHILRGMNQGADEMVSWATGLSMYERLPGRYRTDNEYNTQLARRTADPVGWYGRVCRGAAAERGGGTGNCF